MDAPLPLSKHPKTLLAIAAAAVSQQIKSDLMTDDALIKGRTRFVTNR